jgi:hypothetical protein
MSWRKPRTGSNQPCSVSPQVVVAFRNKACPAGHRGGDLPPNRAEAYSGAMDSS